MISITQLKQLADRIVNTTDVNHFEWVFDENHLSKKLRNLDASQFPLLVVVAPSFDEAAGNEDNSRDINQMLFFILKRGLAQGSKEPDIVSDIDQCLQIVVNIKSFLLNGFPDYQDCTLASGIVPGSFHIDPEYNYLGCNGYSIVFQIKTG